MTEILQANIFFFIASFATIVFSVMACIAMYLIIKILISIRAIIARIEAGSDLIADDIQAARAFVTGGGLLSHLVGFLARAGGMRSKSSSRRKNKELVVTDKE
jgi:hypothetical protein